MEFYKFLESLKAFDQQNQQAPGPLEHVRFIFGSCGRKAALTLWRLEAASEGLGLRIGISAGLGGGFFCKAPALSCFGALESHSWNLP